MSGLLLRLRYKMLRPVKKFEECQDSRDLSRLLRSVKNFEAYQYILRPIDNFKTCQYILRYVEIFETCQEFWDLLRILRPVDNCETFKDFWDLSRCLRPSTIASFNWDNDKKVSVSTPCPEKSLYNFLQILEEGFFLQKQNFQKQTWY